MQRLVRSVVGMLPSVVRRWVETRFPEWTLPDRLVLKRQKKGWAREFNTERAAYERLRPLQGVVIPRYFGEVRYRNRRTMVLEDIGGESLATPAGMLVKLDEFRRLLFQALNAFAPFRLLHSDTKLDNFHLTGGRIMVVDLERVGKGSFANKCRASIFLQGKVDYLSSWYRELQHYYWKRGLIAVEDGWRICM